MRISRIISIALAISVLLSVTTVLQGCKDKAEPLAPIESATEKAASEHPEGAEHPEGTEHPK
jgi:hypothetical protein